MDAREYRAAYAKRVAREPRTARPAARAVTAELSNKRLGTRRRTAAISEAGQLALDRPTVMAALLRVVADPDDKTEVRLAALQAVLATTFSPRRFQRYAADFRATLREVASDPDPEVRLAALDALAARRDPYAQRRLVEGLEHPDKALVPPARALQMIAYDVPGEVYPVLREMVADPGTAPQVRRVALRVLATDSGSVDIFRRIVTDKSEDPDARSTSAVALQSLAPRTFSRIATQVVDDDDDDDTVRATVISTAAHGSTPPPRRLTRKVDELRTSPTANRELTRASEMFARSRNRP